MFYKLHTITIIHPPKDVVKLLLRTIILLLFIYPEIIFAQVAGDLRTNRANVNWNNNSHWDVYNGTAWVVATNYPGEVTGTGAVTILNGHDVTLNVSPANAIGALVVGSGTSGSIATSNHDRTLNITNSLTISAGGSFNLKRITMSVGTTTTIHGSITDDNDVGSVIFTGLVDINNGGSFSTANTSSFVFQNGITNNGTFNQTGAGSITFNSNSQVIGGTSSISFAGIVTVTGISVTNSGTVTLTSTSANSLTGTGTWVQGNGSTLNISGVGATMNITGRNFSSNSNTVNYSGSGVQTINASNYHSLILSGSGTKTLGGSITLNSNLSITGTAGLAVSSYDLDVKGNWNITGGTYTPGTRTVTFSGSSQQTISTNGQSFYNVAFNNTAGGNDAIVLSSDMTISNLCTMTDGIISTGSNKLILSSTAASNLTGYSSACYVNGNLRRSITNNSSTYAFPVGTSAYQLVEIKNNNMTTTTTIDAKFGALVNNIDADLTVCDGLLCYSSVSFAGMWTIDANANPGSGSYDIYCYIGNLTGMVDNEFAILKRPTGSLSAADWTAEASGSINADNGLGRLVSHGYALRKGLTAFSEFGMGRKQAGGALPIQLVDFNAVLNKKGFVDIIWTTATEINNDYFTIERSNDGVNFEIIDEISGAGNSSSVINYNYTDTNPFEGISYYRLKQTDYDGTFTYSKIISIAINKTVKTIEWNIFPNPVVRGNYLKIQSDVSDKQYEVHLIDATTGKAVCHHHSSGDMSELLLDSNLIPGIYFARIKHGTDAVKLIKVLIK